MQQALAYIRVSTDRQAKDGTSLVTQKRRVYEHVGRKGYKLDRIFEEEGETAKTYNRPVLQEMLAYCKKNHGKHQVLIFPKVDRFARYSQDYHYLKGYLQKLGIRVESIDEQFDDSPSGRFFESMLAASAQFDNDVRSERAYNGMIEAVAAGRWPWSAPVGYRKTRVGNKITVEPDPNSAPVVTRIFERLASGEYRLKDAHKHFVSNGLKVSRSLCYTIVRNKIYIGIIEAFGEQHRAAAPLLPLVPESLFYRAQEALAKRIMPRSYQHDHPDFPLRGIVLCEREHLMTACWSKGCRSSFAYYRCHVCRQVNEPRAEVEDGFVQALARLKKQYPLRPLPRTELIQVWQQDLASAGAKQAQIAREIGRCEELQKALSLKNARGVLPDHLAKSQIQELEEKLVVMRSNLADFKGSKTSVEQVLDYAGKFLAELDHIWQRSSLEVKKHIQRFFFPHGLIYDQNGNIRTTKPGPFTDLVETFTSSLSSEVRPADKNAKLTGKQGNSQSLRRVELLMEVYREFCETDLTGPG